MDQNFNSFLGPIAWNTAANTAEQDTLARFLSIMPDFENSVLDYFSAEACEDIGGQ